MNIHIKDILKRYDIGLVFNNNLDHKGYYIEAINVIVVNGRLSEREQELVILHELSHAINHTECVLYNTTPTNHIKSEADANSFMIAELINEYTSIPDNELDDIDYSKLLKITHLNPDHIARIIKRMY